MKTFSYVSRDGVGQMSKGPVNPILIRTEQRQGRKIVTVLSGMEAFLISPDTLRQVYAIASITNLHLTKLSVGTSKEVGCEHIPS